MLTEEKKFLPSMFLTYVADLSTVVREKLEETGECYFYLAKSSIIDRSNARLLCEQALRLFLNVKPPTSNFREMQDCVQLLLTLQENNGKKSLERMSSTPFLSVSFYKDQTENTPTTTKDNLLQTIYDEAPITEEQLKDMLDQTLSILRNKDTEVEFIVEETTDSN